MDLMRERDRYLEQVRAGSFWSQDQRDADWNKTDIEARLDAAEVQPATSEMLCGFVLGAICAGLCLLVWNWKF